jgi:hypothetical protein
VLKTIRWTTVVAGAAVLLCVTPHAQRGFGPGREIELVAQFDKNRNGRLDTEERRAARRAMGSSVDARPSGGAPGRRLTQADVKSYPASTHLYDLGALRTIFLRFQSDDWEHELEDFHDTDVEVPARMTVDGMAFADVGVHFRGNSSYSRVPAGYKRSLNISLDFVHKEQSLGGYRTLNLLNAFGDPTLLKGVLYTEISRRYLPTPRMNYVRVVINGESWGVYLNAQQFNKDFTRDNFGSTQGARWKAPGSPRGGAGLEYLGESADTYKRVYEIKSGDTERSWADLIRLTRVLNETPVARLEAALEPLLDIDGTLRFLAVEVALVNSDGYWTRASDYSLYRDSKNRFHIVPYDVNEALGSGSRRGGGAELDPLVAIGDPSKPLRSRLLAVPALRTRYLTYVRDIAERHLDWSAVAPRVRQYQSLIAADVAADTRKLYSAAAFESDVASIQAFFTRRRAVLLR